MDCDVPYLLAGSASAEAGDIVEIPPHWALDDWEQYAYLPDLVGSGLIESPAKALEMWSWELAAMYAEGGCFVLTCPFLTGRPGRMRALDRLIELMTSLDGLWVTTLADIVANTRGPACAPATSPAHPSTDRKAPHASRSATHRAGARHRGPPVRRAGTGCAAPGLDVCIDRPYDVDHE